MSHWWPWEYLISAYRSAMGSCFELRLQLFVVPCHLNLKTLLPDPRRFLVRVSTLKSSEPNSDRS